MCTVASGSEQKCAIFNSVVFGSVGGKKQSWRENKMTKTVDVFFARSDWLPNQ